MLTQPRIQDSFFRSNVFHRWVQPKSHRTAACQECAHPPKTWTPVILLGKRGLSEIRPSPGPSVPVCYSAIFYFWLPSFKRQLRNIFLLCPRWMVWLPQRMCLVLLPSLLTVLRTEKATNPDDAKALMLGASAGAAVCPVLGSDTGVLSHLPCWASLGS